MANVCKRCNKKHKLPDLYCSHAVALELTKNHSEHQVLVFALITWFIFNTQSKSLLFFAAYHNNALVSKYRKYLPLRMIKGFCKSKYLVSQFK